VYTRNSDTLRTPRWHAISIDKMPMKSDRYQPIAFIVTLLSCALLFPHAYVFASEDDFLYLRRLLKLAQLNPDEAGPKDTIYFKDGLAYCTGPSELAKENNRAADKMKAGEFQEAAGMLENDLKNASLFFPFRYNLGTCYLHLADLKRALLNYLKAQAVVPEYDVTYLQIGYVYERKDRDRDAIDFYRKALKKNAKELNTYVLIGDLYLRRNQVQAAKIYYDACLGINPRFPNGILGRAKIHFRQGEYRKALVLLKSVDTTGEYDKALHYYYAECSYKLGDYQSASRQYEMLLQHRGDKFFITYSIPLIEHKLSLSNRFIEK
jgi:tetratricopeptide (TPR) repeat protein